MRLARPWQTKLKTLCYQETTTSANRVVIAGSPQSTMPQRHGRVAAIGKSHPTMNRRELHHHSPVQKSISRALSAVTPANPAWSVAISNFALMAMVGGLLLRKEYRQFNCCGVFDAVDPPPDPAWLWFDVDLHRHMEPLALVW